MIDKYPLLKIELEQLWKVKVMVIPVGVGALGAIPVINHIKG